MARATATATATSEFARRRHLVFALAGLGHASVVMWAMAASRAEFAAQAGIAASDTLGAMVGLAYAALWAWLAFDRLDTRSGVSLIHGWCRRGLRPLALFIGAEVVTLVSVWGTPASELEFFRQNWLDAFVADGALLVGYLVTTRVASSLAEELVHRALLLRALEGYFERPIDALVVHAVVFELVHIFAYGLPFSGGVWFVWGLLYGYAFQATRSIALPTAMHVVHNLGLAALVWHLTG